MHVLVIIGLAIMCYFTDNHELVDLVEATNHNLEGAGNEEDWIHVRCMYGRDVYHNILLGSIINTFSRHGTIDKNNMLKSFEIVIRWWKLSSSLVVVVV